MGFHRHHWGCSMLLNKGKTSQTTGPGHSKQFLQQITSSQTWAQNHLEVLLKHRLLDPTVRVSNSAGLGWGLKLAFLTSFQVILMLLVWGLHFGTSEIMELDAHQDLSNPNCWGLQVSISVFIWPPVTTFLCFSVAHSISLNWGVTALSRSLNIKYQTSCREILPAADGFVPRLLVSNTEM